jgi:Flp pilus assembly protein CpaB
VNSIHQFFQAAHTQWRALHTRHLTLFLTSRKAQTLSVLGVSAVCAVFVLMSLLSATRTREQWTQSRQVVVATVDLIPGDVLTTNNTHLISLPHAVVSSDALEELPDHASVRLALRSHTVLTTSLIATRNEVAQIPTGWRIVALPTSLSTPPLVVGDAVEIVGGTTVIASSGLVASLDPLTVAVPSEVSAVVAAAARLGEISIVVSR